MNAIADLTLENALKRFETLFPRAIDLSLGRVLDVLDSLGRPQDRLPPVIHVAGTNGKGSTCAFLRAMAEAAGLRVHVYTSPHLVRFNERIRLSGTLATDAQVIHALDRVWAACEGRPITHFEATTAAALLLFAEVPADLLVLEVGLGGRFDATNVVDHPAVSVITPVDYDHKEFLSSDLSRIAWEKAGIIKPGRPCVTSRQSATADGVIRLEAWQRSAPLLRVETDVAIRTEPDGVIALHLPHGTTRPAFPSLPGDHQHGNASTAALALSAWSDPRITLEAIATGIETAIWPARLQRLGNGPLTRGHPEIEFWLDGGHNPHAGRALADTLRRLSAQDGKPVRLVTAMMANKDHAGFLQPFTGLVEAVHTAPNAAGHTGASPENLAGTAEKIGIAATAHDSFTAALNAAATGFEGRILICGSLYLAGDVLALNEELPD